MSELVRKVKSEDGMSTAEYAMGTVAVAGIGGVIIKLLQEEWFRKLVMDLITKIVDVILKLLGLA